MRVTSSGRTDIKEINAILLNEIFSRKRLYQKLFIN